jgi:hypothetical protein
MIKPIDLSITGLGIIIHSGGAVNNILEGEDYLSNYYWKPEDVTN